VTRLPVVPSDCACASVPAAARCPSLPPALFLSCLASTSLRKPRAMRGFFSGLVARRQRGGLPAEVEAGGRTSWGSSHGERGEKTPSPDLDVRIDIRRDSPPWAQPGGSPEPCEDGRTQMVGAGNFGVMACSKEDFMQIQTSVMDALERAEAQFGDDEEFAEAILQEIDLLFDEFELLKQLLVRAHRGDADATIERDALPLKQKLQLGINDILARIHAREQLPRKKRRGKARSRPSALDTSETDSSAAGRGIDQLQVPLSAADTVEATPRSGGRRAPVTDGTGGACDALETLHLS